MGASVPVCQRERTDKDDSHTIICVPDDGDESWPDMMCFVAPECSADKVECCAVDEDSTDYRDPWHDLDAVFDEEQVNAGGIPAPDPFSPRRLRNHSRGVSSRGSSPRDSRESSPARDFARRKAAETSSLEVMIATSNSASSVAAGSRPGTRAAKLQTSEHVVTPVPSSDYIPDGSDRIDVELARTLRYVGVEAGKMIMLCRLLPGEYEIDGQRVRLSWSSRSTSSELVVTVENAKGTGSVKTNLPAYLKQVSDVVAQISTALRTVSPVTVSDYTPDSSDRMDVELSRTLRYIGVAVADLIMIRRLVPGRYEIDGRRVTLSWGTSGARSSELFAREEAVLEGSTAPLNVAAYLQQASSVANQMTGITRTGGSHLQNQMTFTLNNPPSPPIMTMQAGMDPDRLKLMRVACEQAAIRGQVVSRSTTPSGNTAASRRSS